MRAWLLDSPGAPLRLDDVPTPTPEVGQWLVRVRACGLNPVDWKTMASGLPDWEYPHVPGLDVVGQVVAEGAGAPAAPSGPVAAHLDLRRPGGLAEFVVLAPGVTAAVPAELDPVVAAAMPCPGLTAWQEVSRAAAGLGRDGNSRRALVLGGGGPVGALAVQLLVARGAQVAVTCGPGDAALARELGAVAVADYHDSQALPSLAAELGGPFQCIINSASAAAAEQAAGYLEFTGSLASITGRATASAVPGFTLSPTLVEVSLGAVHAFGTQAQRQAYGAVLGQQLRDVAAGSLIAPRIDVVPMADAADVLTAMASGRGGKVVVDVTA